MKYYLNKQNNYFIEVSSGYVLPHQNYKTTLKIGFKLNKKQELKPFCEVVLQLTKLIRTINQLSDAKKTLEALYTLCLEPQETALEKFGFVSRVEIFTSNQVESLSVFSFYTYLLLDFITFEICDQNENSTRFNINDCEFEFINTVAVDLLDPVRQEMEIYQPKRDEGRELDRVKHEAYDCYLALLFRFIILLLSVYIFTHQTTVKYVQLLLELVKVLLGFLQELLFLFESLTSVMKKIILGVISYAFFGLYLKYLFILYFHLLENMLTRLFKKTVENQDFEGQVNFEGIIQEPRPIFDRKILVNRARNRRSMDRRGRLVLGLIKINVTLVAFLALVLEKI